MKITKTIKATAYHEAGHAVVSFWLNTPFKYVTIIPKDDTLGHLMNWPIPKWFKPDMDYSNKIRDKIENEIKIFLAGALAEKKFTGRFNHIWAGRDNDAIVTLASYVNGDAKGTELYIAWLSHNTQELLDIYWKQVELLANSLLKKQKLSAKEVKQLFIPGLGTTPKKAQET